MNIPNADTIKLFLSEAAHGLVEAMGHPSAPPTAALAPDLRHQVVLVRQGYELEVLDGPKKMRRVHRIEDVDSLAAWLRRHATPSLVEILVDESQVVAALAPADPIGDLVSCPLGYHPRFARWVEAMRGELAQPQLQRLFLSTLEDFQHVQDASGRDMGSYGEELGRQVSKFGACRNNEVDVEVDERGTVTFAAVTEKVTIRGTLPAKFHVLVPIFLGIRKLADSVDADFDEYVEAIYDLEIFISVYPREKGPPGFGLSCPQLQVILREARLDAAAWLSHQLGEGFLVGVGKVALAEVLDLVV